MSAGGAGQSELYVKATSACAELSNAMAAFNDLTGTLVRAQASPAARYEGVLAGLNEAIRHVMTARQAVLHAAALVSTVPLELKRIERSADNTTVVIDTLRRHRQAFEDATMCVEPTSVALTAAKKAASEAVSGTPSLAGEIQHHAKRASDAVAALAASSRVVVSALQQEADDVARGTT